MAIPKPAKTLLHWAGLAALLAAAASLHAFLSLGLPVGAMNDDAVYVLLARALLRGSFTLPDGFGTPITNPWPGFPLLLAVPAWLCGRHVEWLRLVGLLSAWTCLALTWVLARRLMSRAASGLVVLLLAFNPVFALQAGQITPELPLLALTLALFLALKDDAGRPANLPILAAGAGLAALIRPEGALAAASIAMVVGWRHGFKRGLGLLAVSLLPLAGWLARNSLVAGTATSYLAHLQSQLPDLWSASGTVGHAVELVAALVGRATLSLDASSSALAAAGAAFLALAAWGAVHALAEKERSWLAAPALYAVLFFCLHLAWKQVLPRYALAVLPFLWLFALAAGGRLLAGNGFSAGIAAIVALNLAASSSAHLADATRAQPPEPWPRTMAWIRASVPEASRMQSPAAPAIMLWTGRPCIPLFGAASRDQWLAKCLNNGIQFAVADLSTARWRDLPPSWNRSMRLFVAWLSSSRYVTEVHREPGERTAVYRIEHPDPARFLRAFELYKAAWLLAAEGASKRAPRAKLKEAVGLEPELAVAWELLGRLTPAAEGRRALQKAAAADPSLEDSRAGLGP